MLALERFELLLPGRREPVERRKEDGLLELEVRGESRGESLERMLAVRASIARERGNDFLAQGVELAVLLRGLLGRGV